MGKTASAALKVALW